MKSREVPIFLHWRVENVQFWTNSIGHLGWSSRISNFPRFHKNVNSLELWKYISENSSPKGSFWSNKRKSEFSFLSWDSRYLWAVALNYARSLKNFVGCVALVTTISKSDECWWSAKIVTNVIFRNILSKFQRVHIFVKSRKVRNTVQSTKMADGVYPKLNIFNTPVQKEGNLPWFHIHKVCNLPFGHSSELKVMLK